MLLMRTEAPRLFGLGDVPAGSYPCPSGGGMCPPFNQSVEDWRPDVRKQMGSKPIDFLMAWIQKESNGNPCSWTRLAEAGISQLMQGDNIAQGGTTIEDQHPSPPCAPGVQTTAYRSSLTDAQAYEQVRAFMQYVDYAITRVDYFLGQAGYANQPGWTNKDWSYWAMVKQYHALPGIIPALLNNGLQSGGIPSDWDTMMQYSSYDTANARSVGLFGQGGGSVLGYLYSPTVVTIGLGVLLAVGGMLATRHIKKRYPTQYARMASKLRLPEKIHLPWT